MRPADRALAAALEAGLISFDRERRPLSGVTGAARRDALIEQLMESLHRVKYVSVLKGRELSERRADPNSEMFDPLMAAIHHQRQREIDEAFWLVFVFVHFGRHVREGWRLAREVYGRLGGAPRWDWEHTSANPSAFRKWLGSHQAELEREGLPLGFGNHRKYQSLDAQSDAGTGSAFETYVAWVGPPRTHQALANDALAHAGGDPRKAFDALYQSMNAVASFGRTARFDYLSMVGSLGLAPIEPGSPYLQNSTGPLRGARLLFTGDVVSAISAPALDQWLVELGSHLGVGMRVLEDALCNWQKSPDIFTRFRG